MFSHKKLLLLALTLFGAAIASQGAHAVTPANAPLTNTATLTYSGNATGITADVTVTVELVGAAPTIVTSVNAEPGNVSLASGSPYQGTYTIQSNANGLDTYTITFPGGLTNNNVVGNDTTLAATPAGPLSLGATAFLSDVTAQNSFTVPSDGTADSVVNGLEAGDTVVIGGSTYTIGTVTDNGTTATVTLAAAATVTASAGDGIYEYTTFTVDLTNVGSPGAGSPNTLVYTVNVTSTDDSQTYANTGVTITVLGITFDKLVRNVTDPIGGAGATDTVDMTTGASGASTYYETGVTGEPGDTLEYVLIITTPAAGGITTPVVEDVLPDFVTYTLASTTQKIGGATATAVSDQTVGAPIDTAFPLDNDASGDVGLALSDIAASTTVRVAYRIVIAP